MDMLGFKTHPFSSGSQLSTPGAQVFAEALFQTRNTPCVECFLA